MYTINNIWYLNIICILVCFQTHTYVIIFHQDSFFKLVQIIFIKFIINVIMCFIFHTQCLFLLQDDLIRFMLDNIIVLLLFSKLLIECRLLPTFLSTPYFGILKPKITQNLIFIWWISIAINNVGLFWLIPRMIYIPLLVLYREFIHPIISFRQGIFSSHFTDVTSTVRIKYSRYLWEGSTTRNFHAFKHIYSVFYLSNIFTIKTLHILLISLSILNTVQNNFIQLRLTNFLTFLCSWEVSQIRIILNYTSSVASHF